jgi:hypothetical protein
MNRTQCRLSKLETSHRALAAACAELWNQVPTEVIRLTIWPDGTVEQDGELQPEATAPRCPSCGERHLWEVTFQVVTRESLAAARGAEVAAAVVR